MRIFLAVVLVGLVMVSGCVTQPGVKELEGVEVNDYEGERLTPLTGLRDVSIKGPQYVDVDNYTLEVSGLVEMPRNYTYAEVLDRQRYSKVVDINCVLGWSAKILWEGILLSDLFEGVGVKEGANTVIFYAVDGYSTSHPLDYLVDRDILLAYKVNNVTLTPELGFPFMLVAEEKWGYKWIKWVDTIELSDDEDYRGYWESRGYSNEGDLDSHFR